LGDLAARPSRGDIYESLPIRRPAVADF